MQEYKFGEILRKKYDNFLGPQYKPSEVYAFSSDNDRTKESMQLVLASLFKPTKELKWNPELNWIPVAYDTLPTNFDKVLGALKHKE